MTNENGTLSINRFLITDAPYVSFHKSNIIQETETNIK
jgi:hypothetical protein